MSPDVRHVPPQVSEVPERPHVKYPFEFDGCWVLRYHIPYEIQYYGRTHHIVVTIFKEPSVHGRIQVGCEGRPVAEYDELTPGDVVEITGDPWRVVQVEYRTHITLERVADGNEEATGAQAGE